MCAHLADNFRRPLAINGWQTLGYLVANKISVSSFFFSCTHCLWDAVGSFLGSHAESQDPFPAWLREEVAVALV